MSGASALIRAIRRAAESIPMGGAFLAVGEVKQAAPLLVEYSGLPLDGEDLTAPDTLELAGPLQVGDRLLMLSDDGQTFHILHRIYSERGPTV